MFNLVSSIKVLSANCQGLRNQEKRTDVLSYFKETIQKPRDRVSQLISDLELADIFRVTFPNSRRYTWR